MFEPLATTVSMVAECGPGQHESFLRNKLHQLKGYSNNSNETAMGLHKSASTGRRRCSGKHIAASLLQVGHTMQDTFNACMKCCSAVAVLPLPDSFCLNDRLSVREMLEVICKTAITLLNPVMFRFPLFHVVTELIGFFRPEPGHCHFMYCALRCRQLCMDVSDCTFSMRFFPTTVIEIMVRLFQLSL